MSSIPPVAADSATTVVIYSGGMDSFTVLHRALREGLTVHALSFDYAIHGLIDNSALTNPDQAMPHGDYAADNLRATVVPNRNMILLSLAIAKAVNIGAERVDYGAHSGDHILYPDCRPEFVEAMNHVAGIANFEPVTLHAPYLSSSKAEN